MDERVRRTVETYERNAATYASLHGDDRSSVADLVDRFVTGVEEATGGDGTAGTDGDAATDRTDAPRVLDVGCGPGWESAAFAEAGFDVVSFDLTPSFLDQARERVPAAALVRGDMRALPFADGAFDGLWVCASLLHVPQADVPAAVADFERVLADGGVVLVSLQRPAAVDERDGRENPYDGDERHFERYEPEAVTGLFEGAGFTVDGVDADGAWVAVRAVA